MKFVTKFVMKFVTKRKASSLFIDTTMIPSSKKVCYHYCFVTLYPSFTLLLPLCLCLFPPSPTPLPSLTPSEKSRSPQHYERGKSGVVIDLVYVHG